MSSEPTTYSDVNRRPTDASSSEDEDETVSGTEVPLFDRPLSFRRVCPSCSTIHRVGGYSSERLLEMDRQAFDTAYWAVNGHGHRKAAPPPGLPGYGCAASPTAVWIKRIQNWYWDKKEQLQGWEREIGRKSYVPECPINFTTDDWTDDRNDLSEVVGDESGTGLTPQEYETALDHELIQGEEDFSLPKDERFCYCGRGEYGAFIGCDGEKCKREWFHLWCTDCKKLPRPEEDWSCRDCRRKQNRPNIQPEKGSRKPNSRKAEPESSEQRKRQLEEVMEDDSDEESRAAQLERRKEMKIREADLADSD